MALVYGSEGCRFESCRARPGQQAFARLAVAPLLRDLLTPASSPTGTEAAARVRRVRHDETVVFAAERVIWITPGPAGREAPSSARVAGELGSRAEITQIGLAVWDTPPGDRYDLAVEVEAVAVAARARGLARYHLFGFSAGATVALAAALRLREAVVSVAAMEPAVIGDDDWHPSERAWRAQMADIWALPVPDQAPAFRQLMLPPGAPLPPPPPAPARNAAQNDMLEDMLAATGFTSDDLAAISQPVLVITGGRSNLRFQRLADRLASVIPHIQTSTFAGRSHLSPPHRDEPVRLAEVLIGFWIRAATAGS
jgi:pimeloyl-ACP methyl ester carboxylesterase